MSLRELDHFIDKRVKKLIENHNYFLLHGLKKEYEHTKVMLEEYEFLQNLKDGEERE